MPDVNAPVDRDALLRSISDLGTPPGAIEHSFAQCVLYLEDFVPQGRCETRTLFDLGTRRARLAVLDGRVREPARAYANATRLLYVLDGSVVYAEYERAADGIGLAESHVLGVGQPLRIGPSVIHRVCPRDPTGVAVVLDVVLGHERPTVETFDVVEDAREGVSDYYYEYDDCYRTVYAEGAELWETPEPNGTLVAFVEQFGTVLGPRVIDLGCGEGRDSLYLARRGFEVVGVDVSRTALEKARSVARRERLACQFFERDVTLLREIADGSFDWAINMGCLHMLDDRRHRLRHLRRVHDVLRPGGLFLVAHCRSEWMKGFFSVPHYEEVGPAVPGRVVRRRIRLADGGIKWIDLPTTHFKESSEDELAGELTGAGFDASVFVCENNEAFGNTAVLVARKNGQGET